MQYRKLGETDIDVSVVCMGCWSIIGGFNWGPQDRDDSRAAIRASLDAGVTFFDTAVAYGDGESEQLLGRELADVRDRVIIATKVRKEDLAPADVRASTEASLRRLNTDVIDLQQIHWPNPDIPLADTWVELQRLREEGKIRAIGVSNFGTGYLDELERIGARPASNQVAYSLLWRPVEVDVVPRCGQRNISVLCYSPICQGLLAGKFDSPDDVPEDRARTRLFAGSRPQARHGEPGMEAETFESIARVQEVADRMNQPIERVALAWLIHQPAVASVLPGARNADQARDNAAAGDLTLPDWELARLSAVTERLKRAAGTNCDMWQHESRMEPPRS